MVLAHAVRGPARTECGFCQSCKSSSRLGNYSAPETVACRAKLSLPDRQAMRRWLKKKFDHISLVAFLGNCCVCVCIRFSFLSVVHPFEKEKKAPLFFFFFKLYQKWSFSGLPSVDMGERKEYVLGLISV